MNDPTKASKKMVYHFQDQCLLRYSKLKRLFHKLRAQIEELQSQVQALLDETGLTVDPSLDLDLDVPEDE